MPLGILFWVIFVVAILLHFWGSRPSWSSDVITMVLMFILAWKVFGFIVQG